LTAAQAIELAKLIERGDLEAKERLIASNLRLVVSIAKRYQVRTHMTLLELVQEGMLGLIRGVICDGAGLRDDRRSATTFGSRQPGHHWLRLTSRHLPASYATRAAWHRQ
jgi:Sigma-70 region 2